jgi:CheY-like chemotaxis protein
MSTDPVKKVFLLADDDIEDAEMFSLALADVDPAVKFYHAENGRAVFNYFQRHENPVPDIIFLDLNMPEVDGWKCLENLKSDSATKEIPVFIYSTSSLQRDKKEALELGATAFITKPSEYKTLQKILGAVAGNFTADIKKTIDSIQRGRD